MNTFLSTKAVNNGKPFIPVISAEKNSSIHSGWNSWKHFKYYNINCKYLSRMFPQLYLNTVHLKLLWRAWHLLFRDSSYFIQITPVCFQFLMDNDVWYRDPGLQTVWEVEVFQQHFKSKSYKFTDLKGKLFSFFWWRGGVSGVKKKKSTESIWPSLHYFFI